MSIKYIHNSSNELLYLDTDLGFWYTQKMNKIINRYKEFSEFINSKVSEDKYKMFISFSNVTKALSDFACKELKHTLNSISYDTNINNITKLETEIYNLDKIDVVILIIDKILDSTILEFKKKLQQTFVNKEIILISYYGFINNDEVINYLPKIECYENKFENLGESKEYKYIYTNKSIANYNWTRLFTCYRTLLLTFPETVCKALEFSKILPNVDFNVLTTISLKTSEDSNYPIKRGVNIDKYYLYNYKYYDNLILVKDSKYVNKYLYNLLSTLMQCNIFLVDVAL